MVLKTGMMNLDHIKKDWVGDEESFELILLKIESQMGEDLSKMNLALEHGDVPTIKYLAHKSKFTSSFLTTTQMSTLIVAIENAYLVENHKAVIVRGKELLELMETILVQIKTYNQH